MTTTLTTNTNSLIIIDSQVTDWQSLVGNVSPDTIILILDPTRDGISQIAELVANYSNLDAIHIISHGSTGSLLLGSSTLDSGNIADYASQLTSIGNALSDSGDILLYGCNVAEGDIGQQFIEQLGLLTGADVAASNDLTGNAALGGDWVLEASAGTIESNSINPDVQYEYLLNTSPTGSISIIGTAIQGVTLTTINSLADADGLGAITYQWQANGIDISGATASTYTLSQAEVGKAITVIAHYTDGLGTPESVSSAATAAVANINDAPTGTVIITGTAIQGQTLTASNNLVDIDGLGAITYQWKAGGVTINGANSSTYILTQSEVGKTITVTAHYTDGQGTAETVSSAATSTIANINDLPTGTVTITGTATQGQTLTASNNLVDLDGLGSVTYQWQANGVNINGATSATYTLSQADVSKAITVIASYTDGQGSAETVSSTATGAVVNINDLPTGSVTITGIVMQGQTLTASNNLADADGLGIITYQWQAAGVDIGGAIGATYTLSQAEVGKTITVLARYTDGQNTAETVSSTPTGVVANVNDLPTGTVTIAGTATQGQLLTVSNNLADADGLGTITYQWQAAGVDIGGATGSTYTLTQAEVGKAITVTAHYTDGQGTAETVSSATTAPVTNINDAPTGTVTITGT
ncbi:MAG: DUF4347 domain-containing protein, partial [Methylococcaceae bacterium]|nr:DUF4347 domain-containing protein [Methylococcaceae bacterium]